jgi:hypothetical protein
MGRRLLCILVVFTAACQRGPVELGFWIEPVTWSSPRIGSPLAPAELTTIENIARAEIVHAFDRFDVTVTSNRSARRRVRAVSTLNDDRVEFGRSHAGESRAIPGLGGIGSVNFEFVANGATVFAPESASREEVIAAIGRGIGRVAIHEFLHVLLPKSAIHDSQDPLSYEGNSPARVDGYFGELHWDIAEPWLTSRLAR